MTELRNYLSLIHTKTALPDEEDFNEDVIETLDNAREYIVMHRPAILSYPLDNIAIGIDLLAGLTASEAEDEIFTVVCAILIFIEEAKEQGYLEDEIHSALQGTLVHDKQT